MENVIAAVTRALCEETEKRGIILVGDDWHNAAKVIAEAAIDAYIEDDIGPEFTQEERNERATGLLGLISLKTGFGGIRRD